MTLEPIGSRPAVCGKSTYNAGVCYARDSLRDIFKNSYEGKSDRALKDPLTNMRWTRSEIRKVVPDFKFVDSVATQGATIGLQNALLSYLGAESAGGSVIQPSMRFSRAPPSAPAPPGVSNRSSIALNVARTAISDARNRTRRSRPRDRREFIRRELGVLDRVLGDLSELPGAQNERSRVSMLLNDIRSRRILLVDRLLGVQRWSSRRS